ncbi:hypothetical protein ABT072_29660 [Streptomyces sp. NPDC002589]|uniref:hypothetical protein n=1 Tax=Streptomyces sp. NPDC002589 TaxID=3154420 RepID=UPI0033290C0F
MTAVKDHDTGDAPYVVVAEVIHGPHAEPVLGKSAFCSIPCAGVGVYQLTHSISSDRRGAAFVLRRQNRPVGYVVTHDGQMWLVQTLSWRELPDED